MKTILILIDQLYLHGGIEKLVALKANYWSEKFGYKIIIVSTEQQNQPTIYKLSEEVEFIDANVNFKRDISFFHPKNLVNLKDNFKKIKDMIRTKKPDFVLVASHIPMTYLLPFIKTDAKIIKEFHYSKFNSKSNKKEFLFSKIEGFYDYLVVLSKEEQSFYASENTVVIPNPVSIVPKNIKNTTQKENIAGAVLRFAPVKQIEKMVEIWDLFYQKNKDWKLYIYGEATNDYFRQIEKLVKAKNLDETIFFKGETNAIAVAFAEVKILLMTSANECFPLVILEANASGVPVISFDSPTGPRNIIKQNKNGILVPLDDIESFEAVLSDLVKNEAQLLTMSENSVIIAKKYLTDNVMAIWQKEIFEK